MAERQISRLRNGLQVDGRGETINSVAVTVLLKDSNGDVVLCTGTTVPTDASSGYARGGVFLKTNGSAGTIFYINEGSNTSSAFNVVKTPESDPSFSGDVTVGDSFADTLILNSRIATASIAGAAIDVGATYTRTEAQEYRYTVSDWTGKDSFRAAYFRAQSDVDGASNTVFGLEVFAVANASGASGLQGVLGWAYPKGDSTDQIDYSYGVHGEFSMDAGRANTLTITEAAGLYSRITSGKVDDYTKIHGVIVRAGDMDGGSRTYGYVVYAPESTFESGTSAFTAYLYTDMVMSALLAVSADGKGSVALATFSNDTVGTTPMDGYFVIKVGATAYKVPFWQDNA